MSGDRYRKKYYTSPSGEKFLFTAEDIPGRGPSGEVSRTRLYRSHDDGQTWVEIPLELSWQSRIAGWILTSWPPQTIDEVDVRAGELIITFHDREDWNERNPLPFRWGDEALWMAQLLSSGKWRLGRVRYLDYDGADRQLRSAYKEEREP